MGSEDKTSSGYRLFKWSIAVGKSGNAFAPPLQKWFSAQLLSAIDTEGVRRFIVEQSSSKSPNAGALLVSPSMTDYTSHVLNVSPSSGSSPMT